MVHVHQQHHQLLLPLFILFSLRIVACSGFGAFGEEQSGGSVAVDDDDDESSSNSREESNSNIQQYKKQSPLKLYVTTFNGER